MTTDNDRSALGARLREAREYAGFSQEDVAQYLGVPRSAISLIESGSRGVDVIEAKKLAQLYQTGVDELTGPSVDEPIDLDSIKLVARTTARLSPKDQSEVLRFAQFLRARRDAENQ